MYFKRDCLLYVSSFLTGTGEHASQQGMNIGGIRHASDIKADDMTPQSQGMLHPQTGMLFFCHYVVICILHCCGAVHLKILTVFEQDAFYLHASFS